MKIEIRLQEPNFEINPKYAEQVVDRFMDISREQLITSIKDKTPVDYGKLRNSWNYKKYKLGDGNQKLVITNSRKYAIFVEEGTGIFKTGHRIFPKNATVFRAVIDKQVVYFRHHKGRPAKHMMKKGVKEYTVKIPNLFRTAMLQTNMRSK